MRQLQVEVRISASFCVRSSSYAKLFLLSSCLFQKPRVQSQLRNHNITSSTSGRVPTALELWSSKTKSYLLVGGDSCATKTAQSYVVYEVPLYVQRRITYRLG